MTEMKNSGTEWLGMIPADWKLSKIGSIYTLRNEKVSDEDYAPLSVTMKGVVPQLDTAAKSDDHANRKLVRKGDFAINSRSDRRGSCGISDYDGSVSLINTVLTPKGQMNPGFYNWLFHTPLFADEFYKWGYGIVDDLWTTRWQEMKKIVVPVPSLDMQERISNYLDDACTDIDSAISEAKASIEDYKALKQSIITQAVTKGLNPKAEMKDSGLFWYGRIPADWHIKKLKEISKKAISYGVIKLYDPDPLGVMVLRCSDVKDGWIDTSGIRTITQELSEEYSRTVLEKDDVVVNVRGTLGGCAVIPQSMTGYNIAREVARICPDNGFDSRFIMYSLLSNAFINYRDYYLAGSIYVGINMEVLSQYKCAFPQYNDQVMICNYLDDKCESINQLIADQEAQIADLEAYKKSLIYECVTGKREVPNA